MTQHRTRFIGKQIARGETFALDSRYSANSAGSERQDREEVEGFEDDDSVVGRFPAHFHASVEDGQLVVRSKPSERKSDRNTMDRQPPSTLAQMNSFLRRFYHKPLQSVRR